MQKHDVLLAGHPASLERSRQHVRRDTPIDGENRRHAANGEILDLTVSLRAKRGRTPARAHDQACAELILRAFNTWAFKREQPSDIDLMLEAISHKVRHAEPLSFALYWGKGPRCSLADPDTKCLDFLNLLAGRVGQAYSVGAAVKLICTDTHARLNGHLEPEIRRYFSELDAAARERGFETCRLSELVRDLESSGAAAAPIDETIQETTLSQLIASARKWYRGPGTPKQGAITYYRMNLVERRAVEAAFPNSIFVTFNGSELRDLFPQHMPIFYMYSLRRGFSVKPWFLPVDATACTGSLCSCADARRSA